MLRECRDSGIQEILPEREIRVSIELLRCPTSVCGRETYQRRAPKNMDYRYIVSTTLTKSTRNARRHGSLQHTRRTTYDFSLETRFAVATGGRRSVR